MFCPKCGKQIADNYKFCTGCGNPIVQSGSTPQKPQKPQETKQAENKNKRVVIILFVVLAMLILVAVGMAVFYYSVLRDDSHSGDAETEKVTEDSDTDDVQDDDGDDGEVGSAAADSEEESDNEAPIAEEEEEAKVTSDTNEVIKDTIIYSIPKSVYSYDFDESLGNAQVVIREDADTMPEAADDKEPQYVVGIDGKAVYLDGSYGILLSDVQRIGTSYTVAFWMKADAFCDWSPFIHIGYGLMDQSKRCRLWLGQKTDGSPIAPIISSEQARTGSGYEIRPTGGISSMQPGVWYHIVFTVDGSKPGSNANSVRGTLYVAGQYAGEGNVALDTMDADDFDVYLGINCWDELYPVAFDGVKIWDQVLDAGQVEELFNAYQ